MKKGKINIFRGALARFGKSQWSSFDWGVYKVNAIPEVQVTKTRMDQWGFQGITILGNMGSTYFKGALVRFGKSQWSSFTSGSLYTMGNNNIFEEALARFGKISMEFLHLGGFMRESLRDLGKSQWSSFTWGFVRESNSCLKGAGDKYSHGPMRSTVWGINWRKLTHGLMGLCRTDLGKSGEK